MSPQTQIRGYELYERIGAGAESVIYRACEASSGRIVAIKHVSVESRENEKYLRHARNEYNVLRQLQNGSDGPPPEGIVQVYDFLTSGFLRRRKEAVLVMQYIAGTDLRRERRYPLGQLVDIFRRVAAAICALHGKGILHGDLKPENIVVEPSGKPTLVDFGFSCQDGSMASSIRGTRDYMAPEQVDMGRLTTKTDIYNFGATMYFLLTGKHVPALMPAPGDSSHFIGSRRVDAPSLRTMNPSVPPDLDELVLRCVAKDLIARPASMEEARQVLQDVSAKYFG